MLNSRDPDRNARARAEFNPQLGQPIASNTDPTLQTPTSSRIDVKIQPEITKLTALDNDQMYSLLEEQLASKQYCDASLTADRLSEKLNCDDSQQVPQEFKLNNKIAPDHGDAIAFVLFASFLKHTITGLEIRQEIASQPKLGPHQGFAEKQLSEFEIDQLYCSLDDYLSSRSEWTREGHTKAISIANLLLEVTSLDHAKAPRLFKCDVTCGVDDLALKVFRAYLKKNHQSLVSGVSRLES